MPRLAKLRREIEGLRRRLGSINARELICLAGKLGRTACNRGKHPTYVKDNSCPLTIPDHAGNLTKGTASSILNQLECDLVELEEVEAAEQARKELGVAEVENDEVDEEEAVDEGEVDDG